jgi:multifunctional methyltransferase subunit TRM112
MVHNLLQCHKPNCQNKSFPLSITKARVEEKEIDYQPAFIQGLMTKIDWNALKAAATEVHFLEIASCS